MGLWPFDPLVRQCPELAPCLTCRHSPPTWLIIAVPGLAEQNIKVTASNGTPLDGRTTPNGTILNTLRNGREIEILEIDYDEQGCPWAKIASYYLRPVSSLGPGNLRIYQLRPSLGS